MVRLSHVITGVACCIWSAVAGAQSAPVGALAGTQIDPEQLKSVFISACFGGSVKLGPDQQTAIAFHDLPRELRRRFGPSASGEVSAPRSL